MINNIMEMLISDSLKHRLHFNEHLLRMDPTRYAMDFATIGLITPRRYGKTEYIKEFVRNTTDRVVVVVGPNIERAKRYMENVPSNCTVYSAVDVLVNLQPRRDVHPGTLPVWVFFDEVEVDFKTRYHLTQYFRDAGNSLQTFIWLKT